VEGKKIAGAQGKVSGEKEFGAADTGTKTVGGGRSRPTRKGGGGNTVPPRKQNRKDLGCDGGPSFKKNAIANPRKRF